MKKFSGKVVKILEDYGFEIISKEEGVAKLHSNYCTTNVDLNGMCYKKGIWFTTIAEVVTSEEFENVIADLNHARYIASIIERKLEEEGGE